MEAAERSAEGVIVELLPSALYWVRLDGEHQVIAHLPSTQKASFVRLRLNDRVLVALSVQDRTRGRITQLMNRAE